MEIYFAYEDYDGEKTGRNYSSNADYLVGYVRGWGGEERVDELMLVGRPTTGEVKNFMNRCRKVLA